MSPKVSKGNFLDSDFEESFQVFHESIQNVHLLRILGKIIRWVDYRVRKLMDVRVRLKVFITNLYRKSLPLQAVKQVRPRTRH